MKTFFRWVVRIAVTLVCLVILLAVLAVLLKDVLAKTLAEKNLRDGLDQCRQVMRLKHYSLRTEQAYTSWIRKYILFHEKKHPKDMGEDEIRSYLAYLAVNRQVTASTQTVALSALLFLYRDVLAKELPQVDNIERARKSSRLPVVFTQNEVKEILALAGDELFVGRFALRRGPAAVGSLAPARQRP